MVVLDKEEWDTYIANISSFRKWYVIELYKDLRECNNLDDNEQDFCRAIEKYLWEDT